MTENRHQLSTNLDVLQMLPTPGEDWASAANVSCTHGGMHHAISPHLEAPYILRTKIPPKTNAVITKITGGHFIKAASVNSRTVSCEKCKKR